MKYKYNDQWYPLSALISLGTTTVKGSIVLEAGETSVQESINYPEGFSYSNSRVLAPSYSFSAARTNRLQGDGFSVQENADNTLLVKYEVSQAQQDDIIIYYDICFSAISNVTGTKVNKEYSSSSNDTYSCSYLNEAIASGGSGISIVQHDTTLVGDGTVESLLRVDTSKFATATQGAKADTALQEHQPLKTVNNQSLVGTGNIEIESGTGDVADVYYDDASVLDSDKIAQLYSEIYVGSTAPTKSQKIWIDTTESDVALKDLQDDTTHRLVTDAEKNTWNGKESTSNKVTSISSSSTNTQYPGAKAVYDYIQSLNGNGVSY